MSAIEKSRAIVFWSAYYLPLLQIFLFALIDGIGFWVLLGSFVLVVAGALFGTFRAIKNLPGMSRLIAGVILPMSVFAALIVNTASKEYLPVGFIVFAILVIMAAASAMQLHLVDTRAKRDEGS